MSEEELKKWFWNKYDSCYRVSHNHHDNMIYLYYDDSYVRKMKLCKLNNYNIQPINKIKGECLFYLNVRACRFYLDYNEIWKFFMNNYSTNEDTIYNFIDNILEDRTEFRSYLSYFFRSEYEVILEDTSNLYVHDR